LDNRQIISHRGRLGLTSGGNDLQSFLSALHHGFGIETDIRDYCGEIYISHDPILDPHVHLKLERYIQLALSIQPRATHLLNIKSSGLSLALSRLLERYPAFQYFVFDMSIPEYLDMKKVGLNVLLRLSPYELYTQSTMQDLSPSGVWLDCINHDFSMGIDILKSLDPFLHVFFVSPDLHNCCYLDLWQQLCSLKATSSDRFWLCTDFPAEAARFFDS